MPPPLLTAHDATGHVHLIIGSNPLASARCTRSIEVGAKPKVVAPADAEVHYALMKRIEDGEVEWIRQTFEEEMLTALGRVEVDNVVDAVFVTLGGKKASSTHISTVCRRRRIPVNVVDAPNLSTFTLLSTHSDGPLQIGITTSGKGCKLAARIRREVASTLPPNLGAAVERLGTMRRRIWEEDHRALELEDPILDGDDDDGTPQKSTFNQLVSDADLSAAKTRRIRWLSQICEYWPLRRLASITDEDIDKVLQSYTNNPVGPMNPTPSLNSSPPPHNNPPAQKPQIILAGSGPGSPHLLTLATHRAILTATIILTDKLVPSPILDLIPRRTAVHIARKFPGNAEAAQTELLTLGLDALKAGHTVLRLKQGDPYIYGRGGEEFAFFRDHGYDPVVLPGVTSALSAPLFAAIPATHRAVADQVLICTGTGRHGIPPHPPPYVRSQTVVFLMALHRLAALVHALTGAAASSPSAGPSTPASHWPPATPCAVVERASCPDQRVIRSTLGDVVAAVEEEGSRPPGLLVVGWGCEVLVGRGEARWVVEEGFRGLEGVAELGGGDGVGGGVEGDGVGGE
ncbi:MAG: siroheme synthase [Lasallia pustulata]|uniref:Siroheme synthase n=1 Tax=Lasallia pustulata TaxID=136370 RepID=A0A5M8PHS6_9LECA|nr:MAG: siroheme synthase [Lasallia pustulata]